MRKYGLSLALSMLTVIAFFLCPQLLAAEEPQSPDIAVSEEMLQDEHPAKPGDTDISPEKSEAILAFTGYMLQTDPSEKLKLLLKAIDNDPDATVPLGCFIRELEKNKERKKFEQELVTIALRHPGKLRLSMAAAYLMSSNDQQEKVIEIFDNSLLHLNIGSLDDRDLPYLLNLISIVGKAYLVRKDFDTGIMVFHRLLEEKRLHNNLKLLGYAALFFSAAAEKGSKESGWFTQSTSQKAVQWKEDCLDQIEKECFQKYVDPAELLLPLDICKQSNEPRRGTDLIFSLLLSKPNDLKTKLFLAVFYAGIERHVESFRIWREIVRMEPTNFKFSLELAKAAERAGRYQIAAAAFRNYRRGMPGDKAIVGHLAMVSLRAGDYSGTLDAAMETDDNPMTCYLAAIASRQLKQYRQSAEWLDKAIVNAKKIKKEAMLDKDFYLMLAYNWERCGELEKSEDALREVLAHNPNDANANNFLGYMWASRGIKLGPARKHIEKALTLEPQNPAINDSMAWVLYRSGNYVEAEKYIDKSLKACGKLPDSIILSHAGDIYQALGKHADARRCWEQARKIYSPDDDVNRQELQQKIDKLPSVTAAKR